MYVFLKPLLLIIFLSDDLLKLVKSLLDFVVVIADLSLRILVSFGQSTASTKRFEGVIEVSSLNTTKGVSAVNARDVKLLRAESLSW